MEVLLLKSTSGSALSLETDPYVKLLESHRISVSLIETMSFLTCGCLLERLYKWRLSYSCIVFCSQRAVSSFASANLMGLPEDLCFAIGPATSAAASKLGFVVQGSNTGSGDDLARFIIENYATVVSKKPVLVLTGASYTSILPDKLRGVGLTVEEVAAYTSSPNPDLATQLSLALKGGGTRTRFLVFFSPSGVDLARHALSEILKTEQDIRIMAIGPTTAAKVESLHFPLAGFCKSPTPEGLLECLLEMIPH